MSVRSLQQLFEPERIIWIGDARSSPSLCRAVESNLRNSDLKPPLCIIPSTESPTQQERLAPLTTLVPQPSLAVICLPQLELGPLLASLAAVGCRAAILVGSGIGSFALQADEALTLTRQARELEIRLVGPDRVGVIVPKLGLNAGCAATMPPSGDLAFVTQSDSIATSMLEWATARRIGFSRVISLGDSADVEFGDILDYLTLDMSTRAILLHLQGVADARRFMSAARAAARVKPVIVLKSGRHIGLAGPRDRWAEFRLHRDRVYDAAFTRAGIVRVDTIEELFDAAASLGNATRRGSGLRNGRLAMLTNGHAPAELAADTLLAGGGILARPNALIHGEIARSVGPVASLASAVDLGLEAGPDAYEAALDVLLQASDNDAVLVIHAPMNGVSSAAVAAAVAASADRRKPRSTQRPVLAAWLGDTPLTAARPIFEPAAIPAFTAPEAAVRAFLHRVHHERRQFMLRQVPSSRPKDLDQRRIDAEQLINGTLSANRRSLNETEAMTLLGAYGIEGVATRLASNLDEAATAARELGFPVALKVLSTKLPQKSAAGGVALDIPDEAALQLRGSQMLAQVAATAPGIPIEGLIVQRMERSLFPIELYLGMELDPTFGPVLLLGQAVRSGGTADLAYLLPPLNSTLCQAMLEETVIGRFLARQPEGTVLTDRVVDTLVRLSQLAVDMPAVRRVAIDPLLASRNRLVVLDAHIDVVPVPPGTDPGARLSVRPYPRELEQTATLRNGQILRLRPIRPEDARALKQLFDALTPEHRRMRLFSSMREISDEFAARLTQIDYDREMVLVALDPEDPERIWAGARIAADADNRRAEYSVTVRSDKQGLGLGRLCLERVLDYARSRGIEEAWGSVLAENDGMLGLAARLGFERRRDPDAPDIFITVKPLTRIAASGQT
jgi:acetyltransferase